MSRSHAVRAAAWIAVFAALGVVAYRHRAALVLAWKLVREASLWWLAPAAVAIGGVYVCRAFVYRLPLRVLGFKVPASFLWRSALIATSLHQLIPVGGASGYAFLTYALHQRGVPAGQASLIALFDTLSYAAAVGTLVVGSLAYLAVSGTLQSGGLGFALLPGFGLVALAAWVYWLQRRRRRFIGGVLRAKNAFARALGLHWPDAPIRHFLVEYYAGKRILAERRGAFYRMIGLQYCAVVCDAGALYMATLALGILAKPWVTLMAFIVSTAGLAVMAVPGGGGSFEVIMSFFLARHGFEPAQGIAAAVLYRVVAFWLPVTVSLFLLLGFRRKNKEIRKEKRSRRVAS